MSSFITSDTQHISSEDGIAIKYEAVIRIHEEEKAILFAQIAALTKALAASDANVMRSARRESALLAEVRALTGALDEANSIILRNSKTIAEQSAKIKEGKS